MDFQMKDVCRIVGIKMSQGQYWLRLGVLKADLTGPTTQGKARRFSKKNLFEFSLVRELTEKGLEVLETQPILEAIPEAFWASFEKKPPEYITHRLTYDPLLIVFKSGLAGGFLFTTHLEIATRGRMNLFWHGPKPPADLSKNVNSVPGFEKVGVILQYYPSAIMVNLETIRRTLLERLQAGK